MLPGIFPGLVRPPGPGLPFPGQVPAVIKPEEKGNVEKDDGKKDGEEQKGQTEEGLFSNAM